MPMNIKSSQSAQVQKTGIPLLQLGQGELFAAEHGLPAATIPDAY